MGKLPVEIKRKLGLIIHKKRLSLFEQAKNKNRLNPYSKEIFSQGICHYHTLTKIEKEYIDDENIYKLLLKKLGYAFEVKEVSHLENMKLIDSSFLKLIQAIEYIDDKLIEDLKFEIDQLNFEDDCIALIHVNLINSMYNLQFFRDVDNDCFMEIVLLNNLFEGLYKGLYNHILGIHYLNKLNLKEAEIYILDAKKIYDVYEISIGVLSTTIIALAYLKRDYLNMVNLCLEMEKYYIDKNNHKRLLHIYNYLADYFIIIKASKQADEYHKKRMNLVNKEQSLERYRFAIDYNMGLYLYDNYKFNDAYNHLIMALKHCMIPQSRIQIVNVLFFVMLGLNKSDDEFRKLINNNDMYFDYALEQDKIIYKYFKYKSDKNQYYRKYGVNKLIPFLQAVPSRINYLLMIYQDLYGK